MTLQPLREDLHLQEGARLADGQPSWTLHDPARNTFFRIDWPTFEIISRWSLADAELIASSVTTTTTLTIDVDSVEQVGLFLSENQLIQAVGISQELDRRLALSRETGWKWILHHYLYFRVPLFKPDQWLSRTLPWIEPFYSRSFQIASLLALITGAVLVLKQYDQFFSTLVDTFSVEGLAAYAIALVGVKACHELGHAFTAKRLGCRIPSMGVTFLVLWPMAYTDTNETWRLNRPVDRFRVASAGILTELYIAVWATLLWAFIPDGSIRGAVFFLATTSWIATVFVNISPFMRFDGYFILCDLTNLPNLHARSFALARWQIREWLFGLNLKQPEYFAKAKERLLLLFAFLTWAYRFFLFLGIATLVYHYFFKLAGIFLFLVEIHYFIALPVWREVKEWVTLWPAVRRRSGSTRRVTVILIAMLVAAMLLFIPIPGRVSGLGVLRPGVIWPLYAPNGAMIRSILVKEGESVVAGQPLFQLTSDQISNRLDLIESRLDSMERLASSSVLDDALQRKQLVLFEELAVLRKERSSLTGELAKFELTAPARGHVADLNPDHTVGQWVAANEKLGAVIDSGSMVVETYVDEEAVRRIRIGDTATLMAEGHEGPVLSLKVGQIDADASRHISLGMLSSSAGGVIAAREQNGQIIPEQAVFRILLSVESDPGSLRDRLWRGHLVIRCTPQTIADRYLRNALMVLVREAGF